MRILKRVFALLGLILVMCFSLSQFLIREDIMSKSFALIFFVYSLYAAIGFVEAIIKYKKKSNSGDDWIL